VSKEPSEIIAARKLTAQLAAQLERAPSFQRLDPQTRGEILADVGKIRQALGDANVQSLSRSDPYALTLETPEDFARGRNQLRGRGTPADANNTQPTNGEEVKTQPGPRAAATETLAARAGALSDEIDFPAFVAGLVHGTFDAIVDSAIRQMEAFADLVSAVAKDVDQFTRENVSLNQARDWLVQQYPADLTLDLPANPEAGQPRARAKMTPGEDEPPSPAWLADYGLEGQPLTDELIEEQLLPAARRRVGEGRLQMLATMVLLGMNRVVIRDGSISARVRFRAAAKDKANVDYAISQDPGGGSSWGARGAAAYNQVTTMVSTVGVNVQAESELKAELSGEVKINFASETLPLDRFVDQARMLLLQRNARYNPQQNAAPINTQPQPSAPASPPATATTPRGKE
jgi:hypothetical protein